MKKEKQNKSDERFIKESEKDLKKIKKRKKGTKKLYEDEQKYINDLFPEENQKENRGKE